MDTNFQPVISKNARGHYRQHPLEFKRALVALSLEPGSSVARIAREHGVNANPPGVRIVVASPDEVKPYRGRQERSSEQVSSRTKRSATAADDGSAEQASVGVGAGEWDHGADAFTIKAGGSATPMDRPDRLLINGNLTVQVMSIRCQIEGAGHRWRLRTRLAEGAHFVIAAQMKDGNREIQNYFLLPAVLLRGDWLSLPKGDDFPSPLQDFQFSTLQGMFGL